MIQDTIAEVPSAKEKAGNTSEKRKRKDSDVDTNVEDEESAPKPPKKCVKKHKASIDTDNEDDDKPLFTILAYIYVLCQNLPTATSKTHGKKPSNEYIQRPEHIAASKITWKPQKPMKAEALWLGGALGLSIMIDELAGKALCVITLTMLPPAKLVDKIPVHIFT
ncbi:hypothetical protein L208DRAFT_1387776 [Tricholoma matsutake]|nr:hypothetical protein L208DRAFT_1387776 [Tricholoma matsutake 945]